VAGHHDVWWSVALPAAAAIDSAVGSVAVAFQRHCDCALANVGFESRSPRCATRLPLMHRFVLPPPSSLCVRRKEARKMAVKAMGMAMALVMALMMGMVAGQLPTPQSEVDALLDFARGATWKAGHPPAEWNTTSDPCSQPIWEGIGCTTGADHHTHIQLISLNSYAARV
jgi:hypothetical protein